MTPQKITVIREMTVGEGTGQRISFVSYDEDTGLLIRPDERMSPEQQTEWDRVMLLLADVGGEDLRHLVNGVSLLDHCVS